MLKSAVAFDYEESDRAQLLQFGRWLLETLEEMPLPEKRQLALMFARGSYMELMLMAQKFKEPGPRLVIFEDVALRLHALVIHVLSRRKQSWDSPIAQKAMPFLNDVGKYMAEARASCPGTTWRQCAA